MEGSLVNMWISVVSTRTLSDLKPPTTTYNHLQPPTTTYNHLQPPQKFQQRPTITSKTSTATRKLSKTI